MSTGLTSPATRKQALHDRALKRTQRYDAKRVVADKHKEQGNTHFRNGRYDAALTCYKDAVRSWGKDSVYLSNIAVAYLKLNEYQLAEYAASEALYHDPRSVKARYRRGVARQELGMLKAAVADFQTILRLDSGNASAHKALTATYERMESSPQYADDDSDDGGHDWRRFASPHVDDAPLGVDVASDSEDYTHKGSGEPCPAYNHEGCARGTRCARSHAPDRMSVRDGLGQNVCKRFLQGRCLSSEKTCAYSHSREYLAIKGWWNINVVTTKSPLIVDSDGPGAPAQKKFSSPTENERTESAAKSQPSKIIVSAQPPERKGPHTAHADNDVHEDGEEEEDRSSCPKGLTWEEYNYFADLAYEEYVRGSADTETSEGDTGYAGAQLNRTVLLLSLENESFFESVHTHQLAKLRAIACVEQALTASAALTAIAAGPTAVYVTDPGIIRRKHKRVLTALVAYARGGGAVVIGGLYSSFVTGEETNVFFRNGWGLPWTSGGYYRATAVLNHANVVSGAHANKLAAEYSMKAVHIKSMSPAMAVYAVDESEARGEDEAPVLYTPIGRGSLGYIGDINAEKESTNVLLALLGLL